jgi:peptidyl-prolyl cis-trans isomerase D
VLAEPSVRTELLTALDAEERDLVELDDGSYFLARIERIEPAYLPELDDIRAGVTAAWEEAQRLAALEARAEEIVAALGREGATLAAAAGEAGASVTEHGPFLRNERVAGLGRADVARVFRLERGEAFTARAADGPGVLVVALTGVETPEPERMAEAADELEGALRTSLSRDLAEYFARAAEEAHGRTVDESAVGQVYQNLGAAQAGG